IRLAELWTKVLGKEIIGREDSFFRLGGHSLRAITLVSLIRQHFNKELSVANLHKAQTLAKQALLIEKAHHTSGKTISAADYRDSYPLSAAQTRMYATWELDRQSIAYNMPQSLLLKGNLDSGELEKALKRVVKRHHALHTVFREVDGEVRQVLLPDTEFSLTYHNLSHLDQNSEELVIWFKNFVRPFDLEKGPLLRGQVVQLKPDNDTPVYLLLIDKHHIISDGTSERIITEEISLLMKGVIPEPVSLQYTDYAIWQQETADPATIGAQRAYWLNKFGDGLPETTFPTDYSRPAVQSFKGKSERFRLENTVTESLKKLAADHNTTLYIVVMTLLKSLLFRYTGMSDMVIGSGTANRTRAELQDVVGMFVNMFLLRSYPSGEKTFRQYLKELQKLTLEAFDNQDYQFDSLFNDLKIKRDPSRNPLFDITFFYQEKDQKQISIGDTEIIVLPLAGDHFGIAKFDTTLFAREVGSELHFLWEYCSDLYTEKTVLRFISHFKTLAEAVAETPDKPLGQFDLLSGIEKHTLVYSYNDTILSYDHEHTLVDIIAVKASQQPDLIVFRQGNEVLTYGDLDRKSGRIAGYLIHDAHIREGDPVGLLFHRTTDYLVCLLAAWKARAYFVPLDPAMPEKRLEGMIDDADITCVLSSARHVRLLNRLQWSCRGLMQFLCVDTTDVYAEKEEAAGLMDRDLWEYVGQEATDDISGGGWKNSYTGEHFSREEMNEYQQNVVEKLLPLLSPESRVLEIGCSSGITMFGLADHTAFYCGTDLSESILHSLNDTIGKTDYEHLETHLLAAHEIDRLESEEFDIIIINSVVQYFHGHNYLRDVLHKALDKLKPQGFIFLGDLMDLEKKDDLLKSLRDHAVDNPSQAYPVKLDFNSELFISRPFLNDLQAYFPAIDQVTLSPKKFTIPNELSLFRFDALLQIDKTSETCIKPLKFQHDIRVLEKQAINSEVVPAFPQQIAYTLYTSGSTGKPKGVQIRHGNLMNFLFAMKGLLNASEGIKWLSTTAFSFDISYLELLLPILCNGETYLADSEESRDGFLLRELIESYRPDFMQSTPSGWQVVLASGWQPDGSTTLLSGGEPIDESLKDQLVVHNTRVWNMYGPTETTIWSTAKQLKGNEKITIGQPIGNTQVYILDDDLTLMPQGVPGELCISGDGVARGYLNRPDLTAEKFVTNPFGSGKMYRTGDLARWTSKGDLQFLGRKDDQVKVQGHRIELREIETVLTSCPQVERGAVVTNEENGSGAGKILIAWVTGYDNFDSDAVKKWLATRLPDYMIPRRIIRLDSLPVNSAGKIDRKALQNKEGEYNNQKKFVAPGNPVEEKLASLWESILQTENIGVNDSFFALGGHSLKAVRLVSLIRKEMGKEVTVAQLFKAQTIARLANVVSLLPEQNTEKPVKPAGYRKWYPLSSAQQRMYAIWKHSPESLAYNMPQALMINGFLDERKLTAALKHLYKRHQVLHTTFTEYEGEVYQVVNKDCQLTVSVTDMRGAPEKPDAGNLREAFVKPFNLNHDSLFRVSLYRLPDQNGQPCHLLLTDKPHIITDGISENILLEELKTLYEGGQIPAQDLRYADYAVWQQEGRGKTEKENAAKWWKEQFTGHVRAKKLPVDHNLPATGGAQHFIAFEPSLHMLLEQLAKDKEVSLYMLLLSALYIWLWRYTDDTDQVIGGVIAGRRYSELEKMAGMFVNTLALRTTISPEDVFTQLLSKVGSMTAGTYANEAYQFEELVELLQVKTEPERNPLFDVLFVMQNQDESHLTLRGCAVNPLPPALLPAKFPLAIGFVTRNGQAGLNWTYSPGKYEADTISRMSSNFISLLEDIVKEPDKKVSRLNIFSDQEYFVTSRLNQNINVPFPSETIHSLFEKTANAYPDQVAITCNEKELTYLELNERVNRVAQFLRKSGIDHEEPVGLMLHRNEDIVIGILGILKAGGCYLPLDPLYPDERRAYILKDSKARIVLHNDARLCANLPDYLVTESISEISADDYSDANLPPLPGSGPHSAAYIIYTSGSTGKPKGVLVEHVNVVRLLFNDAFPFTFTSRDTWTLFHSYSFDFAVWEIFGALLNGGRLVVVPDKLARDTTRFLKLLESEKVTVLNQTPLAFYRLSEEMMKSVGKPALSLRYVIFGGEALRPISLADWKSEYPATQLINMYGITETTVHVTYKEIEHKDITLNSPSIGLPLPTLGAYILDGNLNMCPAGVTGELYIAGHGLAREYLFREDLTRERFIQNPFGTGRLYKTGDLAYILPDGEIAYAGRSDQQVKIRGYRIETGEIESALLLSPGIEQAVVLARKDNDEDGNRLEAYLVTTDAYDPSVTTKLIKERLPFYMVPSRIVLVEEVPYTDNGKVDKKALAGFSSSSVGEKVYVSPKTNTEKILARLWADVLGLAHVGLHDNFFENGGHSLKAIRLVSLIKKETGKDLSIKELFEMATVGELALYLDSQEVKHYSGDTIPQVPEAPSYPVSSAQERLYAIWEKDRESTAYNMLQPLLIDGEIDLAQLETAFNELIAHHDILRTKIIKEKGQPVQVIEELLKVTINYLERIDLEPEHPEIEGIIERFIKPFHLSEGPLIRVAVVKLAENGQPRHLLLIDKHHIISDGITEKLLLDDLSLLYTGDKPSTPALQYKDYVVYSKQPEQEVAVEKAGSWWKEHFSELPLPMS
ncbi:MAG: amino acid adenylation domain-containing protein, partial [Cyclobacteriaceae bacterium]